MKDGLGSNNTGEDEASRRHSTFKRAFGEFCMVKTLKSIRKKLMTKASIYNMLINL